MAAQEIGALRAMLSASSASFAADMGKARTALQSNASKMKRSMETVGASFSKALGKLANFSKYALAGGTAAFVALIKKSVDSAAEMGRVAESLGVTVQSLSTLTHAASTVGIEFEDLVDGMITLAEAAQDFTEDTGPAVEAFKALEFNVTDVNGVVKDADVLFKEFATLLSGVEDGTLKAALSVRILGDNGRKLAPMFNMGAKGIEAAEQKARDLRLEINNETVKAAIDFKRSWTDVTASVKGFGLSVVSDALPALNQMIAAMAQAWKGGDKLGTVLWKALRAPGELERATEEYEKWAEIERKMHSGTTTEKLEVFPYKMVDVTGRKAQAQTAMARAKFEAGKATAQAQAAGDRERQAKKDAEILKKAQRAEAERVSARLAGLKKEEEVKKQAETDAKRAEEQAKAAAAERVTRGEDTILQLESEMDLFNAKTRAESVAWEIEKGNLSDLSQDHQEKILNLAKELDVLDALKAAQDELAKTEKIRADSAAVVHKANRTKTEQYAQAVKELDDLFVSSSLSVVDYERELENLADVFATDLTKAVEGWGDRATDVLTNFVMTGKLSFTDFANSVIRDLVRMQIQKSITTPLFDLINTTIGGAVPATPAGKPVISGKAVGGPVQAGGMYQVNERGPELLSMGNRQFLMMANQGGNVTPMDRTADPAGKMAAPQNVRIVNVLDPAIVSNWASSSEGERVILNTVARNATQLKHILN